MSSPLLSIKLKLVTGYILLVTLFVFVLFLIYFERDKLIAISIQAKELSEQRHQMEQVIIRMLDLSYYSEQMVGVHKDDLATYNIKKASVVSSLEALRLRLHNTEQSTRIDSVLYLLEAKEEHKYAILEDVRELRESYYLVQKRIPDIIHQTNYQTEYLSVHLNLIKPNS